MLQKAVGCTTTMPISGRQGSSDIGLPVQPAVVPAMAPVVPAAIAPTAVAPAAVTPPAIAPPGKLGFGVDRHERLAILAVLLDGVGYGSADGLQTLRDVAGLLGLGTAVGCKGGCGIGRGQTDREAECASRQQGCQSARGTTILAHLISPSFGGTTLPRLARRPQMKRVCQLGSRLAWPPQCSRSESIQTRRRSESADGWGRAGSTAKPMARSSSMARTLRESMMFSSRGNWPSISPNTSRDSSWSSSGSSSKASQASIQRCPTSGSSDMGATPHSAVGVPSVSRAAQICALQAQVCSSWSIGTSPLPLQGSRLSSRTAARKATSTEVAGRMQYLNPMAVSLAAPDELTAAAAGCSLSPATSMCGRGGTIGSAIRSRRLAGTMAFHATATQ